MWQGLHDSLHFTSLGSGTHRFDEQSFLRLAGHATLGKSFRVSRSQLSYPPQGRFQKRGSLRSLPTRNSYGFI